MKATGLTPEQLEQRRGKVMASDVAAYVGRSYYGSAIESWAKNLGLYQDEANQHKGMGLRLEPVLIDEAVERMGLTSHEQIGTVFHPVKSWAGCTPDAMLPEVNEGIQIKNHGLHEARHFEGKPDEYMGLEWHNDLIPEWHLIQCQWEMYVTGKKSWWLGAYFGGADFRLYHLERDDDLINALVSIAETFWRKHLDPDGPQTEPPADGSSSSAEYLKRAYPRATEKDLIPAGEPHLYLAERYQEASAKAAEWETTRDAAKHLLIQAVGAHEGIDGVCMYKNRKMSPTVDWEAVARGLAENPSQGLDAFVKQHTQLPAPSRTFRLTYKPE